MSHDVSSWFIQQAQSKTPANIVRKFFLGTSDYSDKVARWPSFRNTWDEVRPTNLKLSLANEDNELGVLRTDKTVLNVEGSVQMGYTHPSSGDEVITLFTGKVDYVSYSDNLSVSISLVDKFRQLTERIIGTSDAPVDFTGSNYLPADLAWYAITSYGGFSAVQSTSNPDIDYTSWLNWWLVFSGDSVFQKAYFEGMKANEALKKLARSTLSAIYTHNNKFSFYRFSIADSNTANISEENMISLSLEFSRKDIVNRKYIFADYSVTSDYFQTTVYNEDTPSVNSYGLRESKEEDGTIWYVGSAASANAADRYVSTYKDPFDKLDIVVPLIGMLRVVGETIALTNSFHGIDASYRIMEQTIDMDTGQVQLKLDKSQALIPFTLDSSVLDGTDVLT